LQNSSEYLGVKKLAAQISSCLSLKQTKMKHTSFRNTFRTQNVAPPCGCSDTALGHKTK